MKHEQVETENMETDYKEQISNIVNIHLSTMNQLIRNIRPWINELSTGPRIQNFAPTKLTSGILREDAATITGILVRKIEQGRQLCQTFDSSQLTFNVISNLESI